MAKLSDFRSNSRAIQDGAWVRVNEAVYGDLEILTRGFTDEFIDAQNAALDKAAERFDKDRSRIGNAELRAINAGLLREHLVLDVRNLSDDDDQPVSIDKFHEMLADAEFAKLSRACWEAANKVSNMSKKQLDAAMGNSQQLSTPT